MDSADKRPWNGKSRGGGVGYACFIFIIRTLGLRCAYTLLALIAVYFIPFAPKATAAIWHYNRKRRQLGPIRAGIELYRHYYTFGQILIDRVAFRCGLQQKYRFELDNYDRFIELLSHSGAILIGAHIGCWEAGSSFFGDYARKLNLVMFDAEHQRIKEVLNRYGQPEAYKIIAVDQDPLEAMLKIKIALNNGEYVCFNGDRYLDRSHSVGVTLLGGPARLPSGPFRIACRCHEPVVFYYAMRERKRTYRFLFTALPANSFDNEQQLIDRYVTSLENTVRRYPRQWFNFYPYWDD